MANSPEQNTSDAPRPRGPDSFHRVEWDRESKEGRLGDVRTVLINRCVNEPIWG